MICKYAQFLNQLRLFMIIIQLKCIPKERKVTTTSFFTRKDDLHYFNMKMETIRKTTDLIIV